MHLLWKGYAAGPHHNKGGIGSNFLCLPKDPQQRIYIDGQQPLTGVIAGIEYELFNAGAVHARNNLFSELNNGGSPLLDNPAPCAVCYVGGRSTVLTIPARRQCPHGWTTGYAGYHSGLWSFKRQKTQQLRLRCRKSQSVEQTTTKQGSTKLRSSAERCRVRCFPLGKSWLASFALSDSLVDEHLKSHCYIRRCSVLCYFLDIAYYCCRLNLCLFSEEIIKSGCTC